MTGTFPDWDWQDLGRLEATLDGFAAGLAEVEKLEQVAAELPRSRAGLAGLGVTGIEFAAFATAHPEGLGTDLAAVRGPDAGTTVPGRVYRVNGRSLFTQLDITEPLPFADGSVDWVYAEHLIEHVPLLDAVSWLAEVRRILAPGGLVRITTPDLGVYANGYLAEDGKFFAKHRRRLTVMGFGPPMPERRAFMVNQIFYLYGHQWLYDHDELRYALTQAGFDPGRVTAHEFRTGRRQDVADLDTTFRHDETLYMEATVAG
jgi:predicted SAM-dependent methyltransferase